METKTQQTLAGVETTLNKNDFTCPGFTFAGWNTKKDGTGKTYTDQSKITINANCDLWAFWHKN